MQKLKDYTLYSVRYNIKLVAALQKSGNSVQDWQPFNVLEKNISDIIENENVSVDIAEILTGCMLPEGWSTVCLPYLEDPCNDDIPESIKEATIKQFLTDKAEYSPQALARIRELEEEIKNLKQQLE